MRKTLFGILLLLAAISFGCKGNQQVIDEPSRTFPKDKPQALTYDNVSLLLEDMQRFTKALKPLNLEAARKINERYTEVSFEYEHAPLFTNVYPDPANKRIVFLIFPKDARTGSPYLLQFDKKLPVVNESTLELQIRTRDPESPLVCYLDQEDTQKYIEEVQSHSFTVKFTLYKRFMQSGTFDFDGLTITTYRQHGYPFIVFDLIKTELTDKTARLSCDCRQ